MGFAIGRVSINRQTLRSFDDFQSISFCAKQFSDEKKNAKQTEENIQRVESPMNENQQSYLLTMLSEDSVEKGFACPTENVCSLNCHKANARKEERKNSSNSSTLSP